MTKTPIQEWMNANFPPDTAVYARAAVNQMMYFRDDLHEALCCGSHPDLVQVSVVGQHTSKSTVLPVVLYERSDMQVMVRDNYHNIVISVNRKRANGALKLVDSCSFKFGGFAEGFPREWVFGEYRENRRQFTVTARSRYAAYTLLRALSIGWNPVDWTSLAQTLSADIDGTCGEFCDPAIFGGHFVLALTGPRASMIEAFVKHVRETARLRIDWHFVGGRAVIKCLGSVAKAKAALQKWWPALETACEVRGVDLQMVE